MKLALTLCAVALLAAAATVSAGNNYAVLVAGSNGYYNYRHQSDICHAYHVLTDDGKIPKENVITFMYDDIATDPSNPIQGNIINHPGGPNVYTGVGKDYTGPTVTPSNFLAVLAGNKTGIVGGSGRVLQAGPDDNVFVYFSDHGATGLIAFPSDYLYANDLINTLKYMNTNKMYKKLVIYIEACESGSMFANILPNTWNIYATTASTPDQSSYACYWDATRQAYLGDEYSVRWMEDADVHDSKSSQWSLEQQFTVVFNETLQSQPQQYGDTTIDSEAIEEFEGDYNSGKGRKVHKARLGHRQRRYALAANYTPCGNPVDSRDVKIKTLLMRRAMTNDADTMDSLNAEIDEELANRAWWDLIVDNAVLSLAGSGVEKDRLKNLREAPEHFDCLKESMSGIEDHCGRFDDYSLKYVRTVVNLCEQGYAAQEVVTAFKRVCAQF